MHILNLNKPPMKKTFLKPGFETVFALSLMVILGLPPVLLAQNQQDIEIKIQNNDTLVNGKNIKELSAQERLSALKDIRNLSKPTMKRADSSKIDGGKHRLYLHRRIKRNDTITSQEINLAMVNMIKRHESEDLNRRRYEAAFRVNRRNVQSFDYENIDNDGISTRLRFRVSDIFNEDLKKMPHIEGGKFEIANLVIVPEFNTGSTILTFSLPEKTEANVKLISSSGNIIFDDKAEGGYFNKEFGLVLNGVYFLQVRQGNSVGVKRIVKEE